MKNITFPLTVVLFTLFFICSCSGKTDRSARPMPMIKLEPAQKTYRLGDPLSIRVSTTLKKGTLKKVELYMNNRLLITGTNEIFSYPIQSLNYTGVNTLRVVAETSQGIQNSRIFNFTVLAVNRPVNYTYKVVKAYNHSTDHFTQGLEIKGDYLYEGTGENGKSALYQISLSTSRIIRSKPLEDRFFGEGITLLGNKIYQLTYKNQLGFVYDLESFAVIDSFRFASKEGWGLTNDGESLIMSDGTGTLTWINPSDYSIEKKIDVVDHEKVWQYLNELEYVDGFIWANVWGSDLIIQIDANNGEIKGIVNLKGILSVMETTQSSQVDVLNGIAFIPSSGNLLVTGKLWPKMFEIKIEKSE